MLASAGAAMPLSAATQDAPGVEIVALQGDLPVGGDGLPISTLGMPVSDGNGRIAFTGSLDDGQDGDGFVWRDGEILWRNSYASPPRPVGAAPFMGLGNDDQFVFRTLIEGVEALWSHHGPLIRVGDPAPGFDRGATIEFNRRAMLTPDGTAFWVSQFRDGPGPNGAGRVLYTSPDASPVAIDVVLRSDDLVQGFPIARPWGLDMAFRVSRDLGHLVQVMQLDTGSNQDDEVLYVDGAIAVREGEPASPHDAWSRFRRVAINNSGDYLFSATTDADQRRDVVLGFNGEVALREGQRVGGIQLRRSASILGLDLDDRGRAVHLWSTEGFGAVYLLFACDARRLDESQVILRAPGLIAGMKLLRFSDTGHGPVLWLSPEDERIRVEVELGVGPPDTPHALEAILSVRLPACPDLD